MVANHYEGCSAKIANLRLGGCTPDSSNIDASFYNLLFIYWCHLLLFIASICTPPPFCKIDHSGGKGKGLRNETLSVLPIQSILVLLCGNALLFLNRMWRAEKFFVALCNFWRSSVSGIARAVVGGKMRVAGQKVMEAEGDSDLLSSHCSQNIFGEKKFRKNWNPEIVCVGMHRWQCGWDPAVTQSCADYFSISESGTGYYWEGTGGPLTVSSRGNLCWGGKGNFGGGNGDFWKPFFLKQKE